MLVAGLLSLALAPLAGGIRRGPVTPASLAALGYLVLFGSILAYTAYIHLAKAWPAARAGTYAYWNPVVGLALGCWLRGEPFRPRTLPGLGLILLGVALVQVPGRPGRSPLQPLSEAMSMTKRYFTSPFSSRS
jgi:drug/metabolite transporter (DMT)-like permease